MDVKRTASSLVASGVFFVLHIAGAAAATSSPSDYFFVGHEQWGLAGATASIGAPAAWCAATGAGIVIADIDSGSNMEHVDLRGKLIAGPSFLNGDGSQSSPPGDVAGAEDDNGHGSATAGLMVADTDNGYGIAGVAPDAKALVIRVLKNDPNTGNASGYDLDVAAGIRYAADAGARVINLSIGPEVPLVLQATGNSAIPAAIQYAFGKGVAVAVAAGNNSSPAGNEYKVGGSALVVGALGPAGEVAYYSNTSRLGSSATAVQIYAPGGDDLNTTQPAGPDNVGPFIVSTYLQYKGSENAYSLSNEGTSFAAPHVAGTLALLMSTGMGNQQAMQRVLGTAALRNGGGPSGTVKELDAAAALGVAPGAACGASSSTPIAPAADAGGTKGTTAAPVSRQPAPTTRSVVSTPAIATPTASPAPTLEPASGALSTGNPSRTVPPVAAAGSGSDRGGGSGSPNPALFALLAGVIVVGAPAAAWLVYTMRKLPSP